MQQYRTQRMGMMSAECPFQYRLSHLRGAYLLDRGPGDAWPVPMAKKAIPTSRAFTGTTAPVIRFDSNDVSTFCTDTCPCGGTHRRMQGIFSRADDMVSAARHQCFPEAIATVLAGDQRSDGECFCVVDTVGEARRDEMTVKVECTRDSVDRTALEQVSSTTSRNAVGEDRRRSRREWRARSLSGSRRLPVRAPRRPTGNRTNDRRLSLAVEFFLALCDGVPGHVHSASDRTGGGCGLETGQAIELIVGTGPGSGVDDTARVAQVDSADAETRRAADHREQPTRRSYAVAFNYLSQFPGTARSW